MNDEKVRKNIIKVLIVFCTAFFVLIGYLSYFEVRYSDALVSDSNNRRNKDKEHDVLRGSILDREGNQIAVSVRQDVGTQKRVYKKGYEMPYAPVIGYYSSKYGTSGLERAYTGELLNTGVLNPFRLVRDIISNAQRKGNNLKLTIDSDLQKAAYDALSNNRGAITAMNPKTGEILCMVSKPTFNPVTIDKDWEDLLKLEDEGVFLNRAIQPGIYPPGSTFKIIVAGEALQNIKDIETRSWTDNGTIKIGNYTLSNFNHESHGNINLHDALVVLSNVVFGQVGMELGVDRLKKGAEDFYFNKDIAFDLPVSDSEFPQIDPNRKDSLAQSSIGQYEVKVTPLQMLLAVSAIANNGVMMKPYLIKNVTDPYGWDVKTTSPATLAAPLTKETTDKLKGMMIDVVKSGTGKKAQIPGITVAGKTGTAEVGGDLAPHSWFVAFAPADDPQIAISIIVENGEIGGGKAASISKDLIKLFLNK
jgi:peptidoglycan glycosyltransferase